MSPTVSLFILSVLVSFFVLGSFGAFLRHQGSELEPLALQGADGEGDDTNTDRVPWSLLSPCSFYAKHEGSCVPDHPDFPCRFCRLVVSPLFGKVACPGPQSFADYPNSRYEWRLASPTRNRFFRRDYVCFVGEASRPLSVGNSPLSALPTTKQRDPAVNPLQDLELQHNVWPMPVAPFSYGPVTRFLPPPSTNLAAAVVFGPQPSQESPDHPVFLNPPPSVGRPLASQTLTVRWSPGMPYPKRGAPQYYVSLPFHAPFNIAAHQKPSLSGRLGNEVNGEQR